MPDWRASDFVMFVRQNAGSRSRRRREREFTPLTDEEVRKLEDIVRDTFEGFEARLMAVAQTEKPMPDLPSATAKSLPRSTGGGRGGALDP